MPATHNTDSSTSSPPPSRSRTKKRSRKHKDRDSILMELGQPVEEDDGAGQSGTLVADFASSRGFPDLADYFAALTLDQLSTLTEQDLVKNVVAKHRIQMAGFAHHYLLPYLAIDMHKG